MDGAEAPAELLWKKNIALLPLSGALTKAALHPRALIGLLWPDKDDTAARQSVREAIRMVRHYVGDRFTARAMSSSCWTVRWSSTRTSSRRW